MLFFVQQNHAFYGKEDNLDFVAPPPAPCLAETKYARFYFCKDSIDGYHRLAIELFPEGILRTPGVGLIFLSVSQSLFLIC